VPELVGEDADLAAEAAEQARRNALETANQEMDIDDPPAHASYTTMAVVDGIVISSSVCYSFLNYSIRADCYIYIALCL
jgi:hypothetical protein